VRVVLDTNVLVAAQRSTSGVSARILVAALDRRFEFLASIALYAEYEAVMTRREHLDAGGTSRDEILRVLDDLAGYITPVERHFSWRPLLQDADDEMVLETAINGAAGMIVTFETKTFEAPARSFGIETVTPIAFGVS